VEARHKEKLRKQPRLAAIEAFKLINTQQQLLAAESSGSSADESSGSREGSEEMSDLSAESDEGTESDEGAESDEGLESDDEPLCKMAKRNTHIVV
jgi:hypothetical protein